MTQLIKNTFHIFSVACYIKCHTYAMSMMISIHLSIHL